MNNLPSRSRTHGGVLIVALVTVMILSAVLATTLRGVSSRYWTTFQVASWQEALFAAEAGADIAMAEMRKAKQKDATAFTGWSVVKKSGEASSTPVGLAGLQTDDNLTVTSVYATHVGEGGGTLSTTVVIDAPPSLKASGVQWYRVRSTGIASVPGPARVSPEKLDNLLRRLSLVKKPTGITVPSATRTIECIAKPTSLFSQALVSQVQIKNDSTGLLVDSFDSNDSTKSTFGEYDSTKRQNNGDIGSNAFPIKHDKTMDLKLNNDLIFGDVFNNYSKIKGLSAGYFDGQDDHPATNTNPLLVTDGNADPTGNVSTNYFRDLPRIPSPGWTTSNFNVGTLDGKDADVTVTSTDKTAPTRIIANSINLTDNIFYLKPPVDGTDVYAELWVKDNITLKDGGIIQVEPGVHLTVFFEGDLKITETKGKGAGFAVQSDDAADLVLLGVEQRDQTKKIADQYGTDIYTPYKATGNIVLKDADLIASLYAPDHNLVLDVKGAAKRMAKPKKKPGTAWGLWRQQTGIDIFGSFVARTINVKGPANVHYDEELASAGPIYDVGYVSWFEDVNLDKR